MTFRSALTIMAVLFLFGTTGCAQVMIRIGVDTKDGLPLYVINAKTVTPERLDELLIKLGKLDSSQNLVIVPTERVSAGDLLNVLLTIRDAGLTNVIVSASARRKGIAGRITIGAFLTRESLYGDVSSHAYYGGFETNSSAFVEDFVKPESHGQK